MIEPALTAEEWAGREASWDRGESWRGWPMSEGVKVEVGTDGSEWIELVWAEYSGIPPMGLHAVAALCLSGQPFGFTREDVDVLRALEPLMEPTEALGLVRDLADRIEALLPPDDLAPSSP